MIVYVTSGHLIIPDLVALQLPHIICVSRRITKALYGDPGTTTAYKSRRRGNVSFPSPLLLPAAIISSLPSTTLKS
jgi:hypothetical protein